MIALLIFSVIIYLVSQMPVSANAFLILIRTLQIILHLPLLQVLFPANFITMVEILIPVLSFDILESTVDWEEQQVVNFEIQKQN